MDVDDRRVIERAREGDAGALTELYEQHYESIWNYFVYRVGDRALAEDLTSEVFVRMVRYLAGYRLSGRPFLAWLYTIARNLLIDERRKGGQATLEPLEEGLCSDNPGPQAWVDGRLRVRQLASALQSLTETQRQVIIGRFIEERSISEVATLLHRSEGSVKALQHRGLAALRRAFERDQN